MILQIYMCPKRQKESMVLNVCFLIYNNNINTLGRRVKNYVGYNFLSNGSEKYIDRPA